MPELDIHHLRVPLSCWLDVQLEAGGPGEPADDGGITVTLNVAAIDLVIQGGHGDELLRAELPLGSGRTVRAQVEPGQAAASLADWDLNVPAEQSTG